MITFLVTLAAVAIPDPGTDAGGFLGFLVNMITQKEYLPAFGVALVGLVYLLRTFGTKIPGVGEWLTTKLGGWVLNGVTALVSVLGISLAGGITITWEILLQALGAALAASGIWEAVKDANAPKSDPPAGS